MGGIYGRRRRSFSGKLCGHYKATVLRAHNWAVEGHRNAQYCAGNAEMQLGPLLPVRHRELVRNAFKGSLRTVCIDFFLKFHLALGHTILTPQSDPVGSSRYVNSETTFRYFQILISC